MDQAVPEGFADAPLGAILETNPGAAAVAEEIAGRIAKQGGAALFIDYGHLETRFGSTLQAVRSHRKVDPLATPGEADLTALVDFAVIGHIARSAGCAVATATQGKWLTAMGIEARAAALGRTAPDRYGDILVARDRLIQPGEMGELFKVLAIVAPGWPPGAGFAEKGE